MRTIKYFLLETVKAIIVALALVVVLKGSMVEANQIISTSMLPTLLEGDFILVNKIRYGLHIPFFEKMLFVWSKPQRGDVVTFTPPEATEGTGKIYVKRIVATPGDVVEIKNSQLYINGRMVKTSRARAGSDEYYEDMNGKAYAVLKHNLGYSYGPFVVKEGYVFAVGDNRDNSHDSRAWGPLPIENIEGKAEFIYFTKAWKAGMDNIWRIGNQL